MSYKTATLWSVILVIAASVAIAAYGQMIRSNQDRQRYRDALNIVIIRLETVLEKTKKVKGMTAENVVDFVASEEWQAAFEDTDEIKILKAKFLDDWGETYEQYRDRGGDAEYEARLRRH